MKTIKRPLKKAQKGQAVGSKGSKASQVIAGISGVATGAAGVIKNIRDRKKKKQEEAMNIRINNAQKVANENKTQTLKELNEMGSQQRGGAIKYKTGGMTNSNKKVSAIKSAGSKGTKVGLNKKVAKPKK
jgi:hypothetical protein